MIFEVIEPNEILKPFVHSIQLTDMNNGERLLNQKIVPYGMGGLIINYQGKCTIASGANDKKELPAMFVAGLTNKPFILDSDESVSTIAVNFYPIGLYHFLRSSAADLINSTTDCNNVTGSRAEKLFEKIINAKNNREKLEITEQFLIKRFSLAIYAENHFVETAQKTMYHSAGRVNISELSRIAGVSISCLERHFQRQTGLTPKSYSNILRFNSVFKFIREEGESKWHDIIYRCGYYDQAHFIKEFTKFTGETPKKFFHREFRASNFYSGK